MANAINIEVEGVETLLNRFDVARRDHNKVTKKAMQDAAKACAKKLSRNLSADPDGAQFKKIVKGKAYIGQDGSVGAAFGMSKKAGEKTEKDKRLLSGWIKAYWLNYGTLTNRSKTHQFKFPVRAKHRGWKGGIKARGFFERALTGYEDTFNEAFDKAIEKRINELFK